MNLNKVNQHLQYLNQFYVHPLNHRFLTGGPWTTKGSVKRVQGVHVDQKNKALYPFTPVLQELRGPPVVQSNTLGVHGNYFDF
jgi:hypothetical protein